MGTVAGDIPSNSVVLGDSMGEMFMYYVACDIAFIGGSLMPLGGQNLIEACAVGTPVIVGPFTHNFKDAVQGAVEAGAAIQLATSELVDPAARAVSTALDWLNDQQALEQRALAAKSWVAQHTGAAHRMLEEITCFQDERVTP
jgi:3-deoxy-D-manno-octulosonic-acid transferase